VSKSDPPTGVYFTRGDYAGFWRRLLIDAVDFPVVVLLSALAFVAVAAVGLRPGDVPGLGLLLLSVVWFGYFVILKGSRYRTLGYVIAKARIVNLRGHRPGLGSLTLRLVFVIGGPMNGIFDLFWMAGDPDSQALRDKFASTYVVLQHAVPAGTGAIRFRTYTFWGMTFLFREVTREAKAA
jgi:uncharacterized RDD family membrane protein YckC